MNKFQFVHSTGVNCIITEIYLYFKGNTLPLTVTIIPIRSPLSKYNKNNSIDRHYDVTSF